MKIPIFEEPKSDLEAEMEYRSMSLTEVIEEDIAIDFTESIEGS